MKFESKEVIVVIKSKIKNKILQMPVGKMFQLKDFLKEFPDLNDRLQREICYNICNWLERNNFVELKQSTSNFSPYDKECSFLLEESLVLKQEKDNYLQFEKIDFEYKCSCGQIKTLQQFKISKECLAYLSPNNKDLIIIADPMLMQGIYNDFLNFVKRSKKQPRFKKELATGVISESYWSKKKLFKKVPDVNETIVYLLEILKKYNKL